MKTSTNTTAEHSSLATRRLSHILAVFRRQGMRLTEARRRAIQELCAASAPLTVQQLHELVARDRPSDLSTTYRLMNDLAENDVARQTLKPLEQTNRISRHPNHPKGNT